VIIEHLLYNIYYSGKKQDNTTMGKMSSALKPVQDRYNKLPSDDRYNFRRQIRSFVKWYGYISQVCRMFDAEMQKEYTFCAYLLTLLPKETAQMFDLEGALKLEFYKLENTFKGAITLRDESIAYEPASGKGKAVPEQKEPLEEVIEKINALFTGDFADADRVMTYAMYTQLKGNKRLEKNARSSDAKIFTESIFPKIFDEVAQDSYVEQTEAYASLFRNKSKYNAIMSALASILYREFNRGK
jgi:type I restriction enzyme R subunit